MLLAVGRQMRGLSLQHEQTHRVNIPVGATTLHCGIASQWEGVSLPGRRDLTVRAKSAGMHGFEIVMHCGSPGVLWRVLDPAGVVPVWCPDNCARISDVHAPTCTLAETHTQGDAHL